MTSHENHRPSPSVFFIFIYPSGGAFSPSSRISFQSISFSFFHSMKSSTPQQNEKTKNKKNHLHIKIERYWISQDNRRRFFTELAHTRGFSEKESDKINWYKLTPAVINRQSGGPELLLHYKGDYPLAICEIFPELNLDFLNQAGDIF